MVISLPAKTPFLDPAEASSSLQVSASHAFAEWLQDLQLSLSFTTYQTNRLFCVGVSTQGRLALHERLFDKPMGLFAQGDRLYMSTRYQIWHFDNLLAQGETRQGCDRLYIPKTAHTTGDLNVHDVVLDANGELLFVNTDFSCLARLSPDYSFEPIWQPPFISKLVAEDRCHLNGLAMRDGQPAYMTACSTTDTAAGWREHRVNGGAVIDVRTKEVVATGLSMPHSPRWYQDRLWLLNSGTGELGHIDLQSGQFIPLTFCPGFVRGLAFWQNYAFVGLSKLRAKPFSGLVLEERLRAMGQTARCGLMVIDLTTGAVVHWLHLEGVVEELFDVVVLPGVCQPQALGFQAEDIERLVTFPGSGGIVTTKPTVKRPGLGTMAPLAGVPREVWENQETQVEGREDSASSPVPPISPSTNPPKYQRVFHLNAESLAPYDPFTYPSLQQRWKTHPQRGELLGTSASVDGEMVAFAIAELLPDYTAEIISLFMAQPYRQQGIATRLVAYLERQLQTEGCRQVAIQFEPTHLSALALEPLIAKLGWAEPETLPGGERRSLKSLTLTRSSHPTMPPSHHLPTPPKVSLVTTVYNTEAYLAEALESVLAQTFTNWELILWDDGSTDGSAAIAQSYARRDPRIRFHQGDRLGRVQALIQAHALTQGEYVGWLDADDRLAPTALQETVECLEGHPAYGMVYTNYVDMDAQGQPKGLGQRCQLPYNPMALLVNLMTFHFRLVRQTVFAAAGGFNPAFTCAVDYDLCLRVSETSLVYHLEQPLYFYRLNPQGISQQQQRLQRQCSEQAINQALQRRGLDQSLRLRVDETTGKFHLQQAAPFQPRPVADGAKLQFDQGKTLARQGDFAAAVACFQEAIRLQPDYIAAYNQLGNALQGLGQLEAAIAAYQTIITLNPAVAQAYCNLGAIWQIQSKTPEAIAAYQRAIALKPDFAIAQLNLGRLYVGQSLWLEAKQCFQDAIQLQPESAEVYCELSLVLQKLGRTERAIACLQTALQHQPESVVALHNLGCLWMTLGEMTKAQSCFERVIALHPDFAPVHGNLAQALEAQKQFTAALKHYNRALELNPQATKLFVQREHLRLSLCDWQDYDQRIQTLQQRIQQHLQDDTAEPLLPLLLYSFPLPLELHQAVARQYAQQVSRAVQSYQHLCAFTPPPDPAPKLRLGYLSADFREHAVGTLIHQIFQYHDCDRVEVLAYSLTDTADTFTATVQAGCDQFINLSHLSSAAAAHRIHDDGIHILIDLAGYTTFSRPEILALRPAPIQIQYLGYPGTLGAEFIHYILADRWLIPPELEDHYSEQVLTLPHALVASPLEPTDQPLTRAEFGLPEQAVVFCCFNRSDKFGPNLFAAWMRILQQVPESVLWLIETTPTVTQTLRQQAAQQGIDPTRLMFTHRMPLATYLAAYQLADLFLDSFVYNAGATAIHALSAGLPVITRPGDAFVSRMAASSCAAAGLDMLIGGSTAAYEQTAVHLATHPHELAAMRQRLRTQRDTLPLFQPRQWVADLEACCWHLWSQTS